MHYKYDSMEKISFIYSMHKESNANEGWRDICRLFELVFKRYETYLHTRVHVTLHILRFFFFHSCTMHLDIIKVFYLPTDAQENCFKKNTEIYIKTALTCFGFITIIRERIIRAC